MKRHLRLLIVLVGVFALQAGFVLSYVGGLHDVQPRNVPVDVVAPQKLVDTLNASLGPATGMMIARSVPSEAAARADITHRDAYGAYVPGPGATSRLLVTSGRAPASVQLLTTVFTEVAKVTKAKMTVVDIAPTRRGDSHGLTTFYLIIGWTVGGYLIAIALGLTAGMTPAGPKGAAARIGMLAGYAVASGLAGTLIVEKALGYVNGHYWQLAALGALLVFAVAALTAALESAAGIIGSFTAIVLFVVLGNPSAGGPWPVEMLAQPWRAIGPLLPNGAGLTAARQILFFDGSTIGGPLLVLVAFALAGVAALVAMSRRGRPLIDLSAPAHALAADLR